MRNALIFLMFTACGVTTADLTAAKATEPETEEARGRSLWAPDCSPYPLAIDVGPNGQAAAQAELAVLSPGATLSWSQVRNTPAVISGAAFSFECAPGKDARKLWLDYASAHPALFRLDASEWQTSPVPCESVTAEAIWLSATRATYAGLPARSDTFAWRWRRDGANVVVEGVAGSWVPPAQYNDALALRACADLDEKKAESTARDTKLGYTVFSWCAPVGSGSYLASPVDTFAADPNAFIELSDQTGKVLARKINDAKVVLDPSSYTPELLQSDANCPLSGGTPHVGFALRFDAVTGRLDDVKPGIGCIVCLAP
ncbi:MAG: hypothetical protein JNK82_14380 [Myxococcaceae bacterium]|nr:hypothetical protein [Myxococcaceae bacterium]